MYKKIEKYYLKKCSTHISNSMTYKLIKELHKKPKLEYQMFDYEFNPYYLSIQPNIKVKDVNEFKQELLQHIIEDEKSGFEDIEDDPEIKTEQWYQFSLHNMGEEDFLKELERLYCTPLNGQWNNIFIDLSPYFIDSQNHYAHVKFDKIPSMVELLYTHCCLWQEFYKNKEKNIDNICHHYSVIMMRGDRYNLIFHPGMDS